MAVGGLVMLRYDDAFLHIVGMRCALTLSTSGSVSSSYVDMYNATSNSWTAFPAGLGQARGYLAAASLVSGLVFFAGGRIGAS
jgi:hypothetical protein